MITALEKKCREALQYEAVRRWLKNNNKAFDQICALLDFVGDSESALSSVDSSEKRRLVEHYFLAYGLLQLMYARQVSLTAVLKTISVRVPDSLKENSVSAARARVIGHPITSDGGAHVIVRNTLDENGFEYWSYRRAETSRGNLVDYESLLGEHTTAMTEGLTLLFGHLAALENERRRTMRQEPLHPLFQGLSYLVRCVAASVVEEKYGQSFQTNVKLVISALERIRAALAKRYDDEFASYNVDPILEGIRMLTEIFPPQSKPSEYRYGIISDGIEVNFGKLARLAGEIDEKEEQEIV